MICIPSLRVFLSCVKTSRENCPPVQFKGEKTNKLRSKVLRFNRASISSESDRARVEEAGSTEWSKHEGEPLSQTAAFESK